MTRPSRRRRRRRGDARTAGSSRTPTGGSRRVRWTLRALQAGDAAVPARRRARADPVDAQVVDHADPGHAADADGAVPARLRPRAAGDGLVADPHRPLRAEHGRASRSGRGPSRSSWRRPAGYALSVLRPRFGRLMTGLVIATLFVPPIVLLVPLYLTIVDVPIVHCADDRQLLGDLAAGRGERDQRRPGEALLRQPAARDLRGGAGRRRGPVPAVLVDRAADVAADPRRRVGVRA